MAKQGFFYNQDRCTGCKTCQVACKDKNDLPLGVQFRTVRSFQTGSYPTPSLYHASLSCNHCLNPACVEVCPIGAMYVSEEDGTVQYDDSLCIGCQYCVNACPYGNPHYITDLKVVRKCDACITLRQSGEAPACVASCPARALEFGPLEELMAAYPNTTSDLPILPDPSHTTPSFLVQPKACALLDSYREIVL